jgi:hypothetical protein
MAQHKSQSGNGYHNAMMASCWATLKKELVHGLHFRTDEESMLAAFEWIEVWYQRARIHGSLGHVGPEAFEAAARARFDQDWCARVARKSTARLRSNPRRRPSIEMESTCAEAARPLTPSGHSAGSGNRTVLSGQGFLATRNPFN